MRWVGVLAASLLLAIAFFASRRLEAEAERQNHLRAETQASHIGIEAISALDKQLALFQVKAHGAAATPELGAIMRGASNDPDTLRDGFNTEPWWQRFRENGGATAVYLADQKFVATATLLDDADLKPLALTAETSGEASALIAHDGLYLVAASRMAFNVHDKKVSVVLTRPLSQSELDGLATAPLLFSDGNKKLGARGDVARLEPFIGREDKGLLSLDGAVASARPLGKLWVWSFAPVLDEVAPSLPPLALWSGACVLGLVALTATFFGGRKKPGPVAPRVQTLPMPVPLDHRSTASHPNAPELAMDRTTPSATLRSRYIELAPLGEGGMAKISIAVTLGEQGFRRQFVVKRLKSELSVNPAVVAQFIDEARLGASLVHSNIVPVFDFGRDTDGYFIAQEYIMGRDLDAVRRALWERSARLDLNTVLYVAQEALQALSYAHAKTDDSGKAMGLVHRDVSPNNLMVSARGEVKLLDFGIVKADSKLSHTQEGMIKGNVFYMSPEQARGLPVDPRADLFSLGLVLYTAFSGETLYRGVTNYDLLTRAGEGLGKTEWELVRKLPPELAQLLERALQADPKNRFSSAEEFARAIPSALVAQASVVQKLMETLFTEAFTQERARFNISAPEAP